MGIFDRLRGDEMVMTQKLISKMLGVRRDEVTAAALALSASGDIAYRVGHIKLRDRTVLEASSCECDQAVRQERDRLLPPAPRAN